MPLRFPTLSELNDSSLKGNSSLNYFELETQSLSINSEFL